MSMLEFFRPNHCDEQINKEQQRDDRDDGRFHFELLKLLAKTNVESAHNKKGDNDSDENEVAHTDSLTISEVVALVLIKPRPKCVKKLLTPQRPICSPTREDERALRSRQFAETCLVV
jgi:hypothetical protein